MTINMHVMNKAAALGAVLGVGVLVCPVHADEDSGWYMGGSYGRSDATFDERDIRRNLQESGFSTTLFTDDGNDRGYKVFGGYQFNRFLALEGGFYDLGAFSFTARTDPPGSLFADMAVDGFNLDAVGLFPLGERFAILARVGAAHSEANARFRGTGAVNPVTPLSSETDTNIKYGFGAQWAMTGNLGLQLEAERYHFDDGFDNQADIDFVSLGLVARFGGY